jgi:hypothetical protein
MIIWKKKLIKCCRCHKDYSFDNNLFYYLQEYILICPKCNLMHKVDIKLLDDKYKELKKIDRLNLAAIDIGSAAINGDFRQGSGYTYVNANNPANDTGKITSVEIWAESNMSKVEVAIFYIVSGNTLSTRSYTSIGSVTSGSKQTFPVNLDVVAGNYIGVYFTSGWIEVNQDASTGLWWKVDDQIPCTNANFTVTAHLSLSLYGTGATAEVGGNAIMMGTNF